MLKLHRGFAPKNMCFPLGGFDAMVAHYRMCVNIGRLHHVCVNAFTVNNGASRGFRPVAKMRFVGELVGTCFVEESFYLKIFVPHLQSRISLTATLHDQPNL